MADNFLEKQRAEYEIRKEQWLKKKRHVPNKIYLQQNIEKPEDETL